MLNNVKILCGITNEINNNIEYIGSIKFLTKRYIYIYKNKKKNGVKRVFVSRTSLIV